MAPPRRHPPPRELTIALVDVAALAAAFPLGGLFGLALHEWLLGTTFDVWSRPDEIGRRALFHALLATWVLAACWRAGRAGREADEIDKFLAAARYVLAAAAIDIAVQYILKQPFSRLWLGGSWLAALLLLPLAYRFSRLVSRLGGWWSRNLVLVGDAKSIEGLARDLALARSDDFVLLSTEVLGADEWDPGSARLAAVLEQAAGEAAHVIVAVDGPGLARIVPFCGRLEAAGIGYSVSPNLGPLTRRGMLDEIRIVDGVPLISEGVRILHPLSRWSKRSLDLAVAGLALVLLAPVLLALALLVRRDGGPAIFRHERVGRAGRPFGCLKFRTMAAGADGELETHLAADPALREEWESTGKLRRDPRVTGLGRFLRESSLDELPQLWNVVRGEMSLVGPRPVTAEELGRHYGGEAEVYTRMRPGITGLWQVSGRNQLGYEQRVDMDSRYARTWSLGSDLEILLRTVPVVLRGEGAS